MHLSAPLCTKPSRKIVVSNFHANLWVPALNHKEISQAYTLYSHTLLEQILQVTQHKSLHLNHHLKMLF